MIDHLPIPLTKHPLPVLGKLLGESDLLYETPGVYLLLKRGEVVYVGQSSNIRMRLRQHRESKSFDDVQLYHIPDLKSRLRVEGILALWYLPEHNHGFNLGLAHGDVWEIRWGHGTKAKKKVRRRRG